jgi:hypothetical protein
MRRLALPLALVLMVALPAGATADIRFRGKSGQGRLVTLRTDDGGTLERVGLRWSAPCDRSAGIFARTWFRPPFDAVSPDRFVDAGSTRGRLEDGLRVVDRVRIAGRRVSEHRWRGVFRVRLRVLREGRVVGRCYKRTRWRVVRQG